MHRKPKFTLIETKQIIPDKNVFGQKNFASNAFNVVVRLTKTKAQGVAVGQSSITHNSKSQQLPPQNIINNWNLKSDIQDVYKDADAVAQIRIPCVMITSDTSIDGECQLNKCSSEVTPKQDNNEKYGTIQAISPSTLVADALAVSNECHDHINSSRRCTNSSPEGYNDFP